MKYPDVISGYFILKTKGKYGGKCMTKKKSLFFLISGIIFFLVLIFLDQFTKYEAWNKLQGQSAVIVLPHILAFEYLEGGNAGAAWGIFSGKLSFLLCLNFVIILLLIFFLYFLQYKKKVMRLKKNTMKKITLSQYLIILLIAGAIGNMIDRIRLGYVIDFIAVKFVSFPIFNVADCYVVISSLSLLFLFIFGIKEEELQVIFSKKSK